MSGSIVYPDTLWDDLRFPSNAVNPPGLVSDPDVDTNDGTYLFDAASTELLFFMAQMPHAWKEGSAIHPHVHWEPMSTNGGNVLWRFSYQVANIGGVFSGAWTDLDVLDAGAGVLLTHQLAAWASVSMSGLTLSAMIKMKVSRIGGDGTDTFTADAKLLEFDLHYEIDAPGSREELIK